MNNINKNAPIGIFDSGAGGISVMGRIAKLLPSESFVYYADSANFPYGDKSSETVRRGVLSAAADMAEAGIKMLVVACNTATAVAIDELRDSYDFPVLGIEPALKPAVQRAEKGKVAVIATSLTLKENKFRRLFDEYQREGSIVNLPAPGLADMVEKGGYKSREAKEYLEKLFEGEDPDIIVLGCTHYLFLYPVLKDLFPKAEILDGGEGLARNVEHTLKGLDMLRSEDGGTVKVMSSGAEFGGQFLQYYTDIIEIIKKL